LGLGDTEDGNPYLVAVNGDGVIELLLISDVTVNWRYDPKTELWSDTDTGVTEQPFGDAEDG